MNLNEILELLREQGLLLDSQGLAVLDRIAGKICVDNRDVAAGDVFVCIKGLQNDGHNYIEDARSRKAALVVCENEFTDSLPALRVSDSRKAAALLAQIHYHDPSSRFRLVGVTGTNGKTTTSLLLFQAVRELGLPAGWIGTLGYYINDEQYETGHTTPDILELNSILAKMADRGVKFVFMEVSSHALALDRVYGIKFDYCLFTNLSREHLDFHHNMDEYGATKMKLFEATVRHEAIALVNIDDSYGALICQKLKEQDAYVFSLGSSEADYVIRMDQDSHKQSLQQSRFALQTPDGVINLRSSLIGRFNVANLAMSAATLDLMGLEKRQIEQGLNAVPPVKGRFERVPGGMGISVFVDYAHSPDALENVLRASRDLEHRRILCLFGAGGERDHGKRPLMLKAALQHSDAVIITDDNPRGENPEAIIRDIVTGSDTWLPWWIIRDRRQAIRAILRLAQPGDIVLLCGKGHENYQVIGSQRLPFDDREIALACLAELAAEPQESDDLALPVERLLLILLAGQEPGSIPGYIEPRSYMRISTDSRSLQPGSLFFALKGHNYDANDFLSQVLNDHSVFAIGQRELADHANYLCVPDTLTLLAALLRKYLLMFPAYKIALTGSTGKSGTKEMLAQIFSAGTQTLKTAANENNLIGLCRTIAKIRPEHQYAVLELGTNAPGEIAALSEVCNPDAGIILNVGPSHLAGLVDEDGVFREKVALFNRPLDIRLFDADDSRFAIYADRGKGVGFTEQADFRISAVQCGVSDCEFELNEERYQIPYPYPYAAKNAAFAISCALLKGIPAPAIRDALRESVRLELRLSLEQTGSFTLVIDCYNANPVSMQAAIEYWKRVEPEREHIAILGDMMELGSAAAAYHDMIGAILNESGYDRLITVGDLSVRYQAQDSSLRDTHFADVEELLASSVLGELTPKAVILIKGSHSLHLEKVLPQLRKEV